MNTFWPVLTPVFKEKDLCQLSITGQVILTMYVSYYYSYNCSP